MAGLCCLLIPKNVHRVDAGCPPRWEETGSEGDGSEDEQDAQVGFWIEPRDTEEQRAPPCGSGEAAGCDQSNGGPNGKAGEDQRSGAYYDERGYVAAISADGHAQADFAGA